MSADIHKRYLLELGGALLLYAAMLFGSIYALQHGMEATPWRDALALSPMLACVLALWAILRQLRRLDELQRRVQLEALGFAFAGTAFLSFGYGFLEGVGYPRLSMFVIWPLMGALWMIGLQLAVRRYR